MKKTSQYLLLTIFALVSMTNNLFAADFAETLIFAVRSGIPDIQIENPLPYCKCTTPLCPQCWPRLNGVSPEDQVNCLLGAGASVNPDTSVAGLEHISHFGRVTCNYPIPNLDPPIIVGANIPIGILSRSLLYRQELPFFSSDSGFYSDENDLVPGDKWVVSGSNFPRRTDDPSYFGYYYTVHHANLTLPDGWRWLTAPFSSGVACGPDPAAPNSPNKVFCYQRGGPFQTSNAGCPRRSPNEVTPPRNPNGSCQF